VRRVRRASLGEDDGTTGPLDPFAILDLRPADRADPEAVRRAYKRAALVHHPDRNRDDPIGAQRRMAQVERARRTLTDPEAWSNWEAYGDPDGPGAVTRYGAALPDWLMGVTGDKGKDADPGASRKARARLLASLMAVTLAPVAIYAVVGMRERARCAAEDRAARTDLTHAWIDAALALGALGQAGSQQAQTNEANLRAKVDKTERVKAAVASAGTADPAKVPVLQVPALPLLARRLGKEWPPSEANAVAAPIVPTAAGADAPAQTPDPLTNTS